MSHWESEMLKQYREASDARSQGLLEANNALLERARRAEGERDSLRVTLLAVEHQRDYALGMLAHIDDELSEVVPSPEGGSQLDLSQSTREMITIFKKANPA